VKVRLETDRHQLVADLNVTVPRGSPDPTVVIWGDKRYFVYDPASPNDDAFVENYALVVSQADVDKFEAK
jgi:hypothetical protein